MELEAQGQRIGELVFIIDGLDECDGNPVQCEIIKIIATSVRDRTTPLRWVLVSRPEVHIITTFTSQEISSLSLHVKLPVSRGIDNETTKYLADELRGMGMQYGLDDSWPSERDIGTLVNLSAGLFIYAATVVRFIRTEDPPGPEDQLEAVLNLAAHLVKPDDGTSHPLSELDLFYTLLMQRIPPKVLSTICKILLVTKFLNGTSARTNAYVLGLSES